MFQEAVHAFNRNYIWKLWNEPQLHTNNYNTIAYIHKDSISSILLYNMVS